MRDGGAEVWTAREEDEGEVGPEGNDGGGDWEGDFGMGVDEVGVREGMGIRKVIDLHQSSSWTLCSSMPADTSKGFMPRGTKKVTGRSTVERLLSARTASRCRWS